LFAIPRRLLPKPEEKLVEKHGKKHRQDKFYNGEIKNISSSELKKGDVLFCDGDLVQLMVKSSKDWPHYR
jgi:hypothetical protein